MNGQKHTSLGKSQHFSHALHHHLVRKGVPNHVAAAMSAALVHPAKFAYDHSNQGLDYLDKGHTLKELPAALKGLKQAEHLLSNPMMSHAESITALTQSVAVRRASIAAGGMVIAEAAIKYSGIPYNKCALSVGKVTIDAAEVVGGSLAAETVVGGIFAAISIHAASEDSMELVTECFGVPKEKQEETRNEAMSMRTVLYHP